MTANAVMKLTNSLIDGEMTLARLTPRHADGPYLNWFEDAKVTRYLMPIEGAMSAERLRRYIADNAASADSLLVGIFVGGGARHVGNIRLTRIDCGHSRAGVGIMVGERDCWGKDMATRAIRMLTAYAGEALDLRYLYAGCHAANAGSVGAFRNAGWVDWDTAPAAVRGIKAFRDCINVGHVTMIHCREWP